MPDKQIFEETVYDYDILKQRFEKWHFLPKGLALSLQTKEGMEREKIFHYEGGIREFVTYLNKNKELCIQRLFTVRVRKTALALKLQCSTMIPIQRILTDL